MIGLVSLNDRQSSTNLRRENEIYKKDLLEARKTITKINLENHNLKLNLLTANEKIKALEKENNTKENNLRTAKEKIEELEKDTEQTRILTGKWTKFKQGKVANSQKEVLKCVLR